MSLNVNLLTCWLSFITVLFCVNLTSTTLLKCKYQERDIVWQKYCCVVEELRNENHSTSITSISGSHVGLSRSDDDVKTLRIENIQTIRYFTNDLFVKFPQLRNLVIHDTSLMFLFRGDFVMAKKLKNIFITHNSLMTLANAVFYGAEQVKSLNLRHNKIHDIEQDAFSSLSTLKHLVLSFNMIKSLNNNLFKNLTYLEQLSLNENQIMHIHEDQFEKNVNLKKIFLGDNEIESFNGNVFKNTKELREIYMENNRIKRISFKITFLSHLKSLQIATFNNNSCVDSMIIPMGIPTEAYPFDQIFVNCT